MWYRYYYDCKIARTRLGKIVKTLKGVGVPTTAKEIGLKPGILAKALTIAQSLRPERYTVLKEVNMTEKKAVILAKSTNVL